MAKSIRAKSKMAARKKKREVGNYAAADAARVQRLSEKLHGKDKKADEDMAEDGAEAVDEDAEMENPGGYTSSTLWHLLILCHQNPRRSQRRAREKPGESRGGRAKECHRDQKPRLRTRRAPLERGTRREGTRGEDEPCRLCFKNQHTTQSIDDRRHCTHDPVVNAYIPAYMPWSPSMSRLLFPDYSALLSSASNSLSCSISGSSSNLKREPKHHAMQLTIAWSSQ
jgi:hypothetical protein